MLYLHDLCPVMNSFIHCHFYLSEGARTCYAALFCKDHIYFNAWFVLHLIYYEIWSYLNNIYLLCLILVFFIEHFPYKLMTYYSYLRTYTFPYLLCGSFNIITLLKTKYLIAIGNRSQSFWKGCVDACSLYPIYSYIRAMNEGCFLVCECITSTHFLHQSKSLEQTTHLNFVRFVWL